MTQSRTHQRSSFLLGLAIAVVGSRAFAQPAPPEPPPPVEPWYEALQFSAFVDGYTSFNYNLPPSVEDANTLRVNDQSNGFALSWAGADVGAEPDPVGGHIGLRFGPLAHSLCGQGRSEDCYQSGLDMLPGLGTFLQEFADLVSCDCHLYVLFHYFTSTRFPRTSLAPRTSPPASSRSRMVCLSMRCS